MIKYIFSINTGRSGSHYLSNILGEFENITALHEPEPVMNGEVMSEYLIGNSQLLEDQMEEKMNAINAALNGNKHYIETNHTFIKGFGWLLPSMIPQNEMGVIFIKRAKDEIVNSFYRINTSALTYLGSQWIMNPLMKNPEVAVPFYDKIKYKILLFVVRVIHSKYNPLTIDPKSVKFLKRFELKYLAWYVEETYAQGEKFKKKYPAVKVFETTIHKLNETEELKRMFDFFKLEFKPKNSFFEKVDQRTNLKAAKSK